VFSFNHPSAIRHRLIDSCIHNFIVLDFIILSSILFIYSINGSVKITNNSFEHFIHDIPEDGLYIAETCSDTCIIKTQWDIVANRGGLYIAETCSMTRV
jgi:hypothetical protein